MEGEYMGRGVQRGVYGRKREKVSERNTKWKKREREGRGSGRHKNKHRHLTSFLATSTRQVRHAADQKFVMSAESNLELSDKRTE